jgi:hypothetical protein
MPVLPQDITQVVSQESSKLGEQGRLEPTIRTTFRVRSQGPFSIELPKAGWTADAADKAIQEYASHLVTLRDKYPGA